MVRAIVLPCALNPSRFIDRGVIVEEPTRSVQILSFQGFEIGSCDGHRVPSNFLRRFGVRAYRCGHENEANDGEAGTAHSLLHSAGVRVLARWLNRHFDYLRECSLGGNELSPFEDGEEGRDAHGRQVTCQAIASSMTASALKMVGMAILVGCIGGCGLSRTEGLDDGALPDFDEIADVEAIVSSLEGAWTTSQDGSTTSWTSWYVFEKPDRFETIVESVGLGGAPRLVVQAACGRFEVTPDGTVTYAWTNRDGVVEVQSRTFAPLGAEIVRDLTGRDDATRQWTHAGYLAVSGDAREFRREFSDHREDPEGEREVNEFVTRLTFDPALKTLGRVTAATPCRITVDISGSVQSEGSSNSAVFGLTFPCHIGPVEGTSLQEVTLDDLDTPGYAWGNYISIEHGGRYDSSQRRVIVGAFKPHIYYLPEAPTMVFHPRTNGYEGFMENLNTPPAE